MVYPHCYRTEHSETRTTNGVYGEYYAQEQSRKIKIQPELLKIIQYIDSHRAKFKNDLAAAVQIKSLSGDLAHKKDMLEMVDFTQGWLSSLGFKYERFNIGFHQINGQKVRLPTIILASLGADPHKRTLCIYVHLDVKKTDEAKWGSDPWSLTEKDGFIFGCGVAQGKGTLMQWFHVIEAFQSSQTELPVNLKFIIEGMYHHESIGLGEFLLLRKQDFFETLDHIIVCDSEWIGDKHPCIVYGTVGVIHFDLIIEKNPSSKTDPRDDLVKIFKEIVDEEERILIPHIDDIVTQITPAEEKIYEQITDFDMEEVKESLPPYRQKWDKVKLLMYYWRLPSIWVGETEECNCDKKENDIVKKHFILKVVPRQIIDRTIEMTTSYVSNIVKKLKIENKVVCEVGPSVRYWHENVANHSFQAARRATIQIYKEDPNMIREDRTRVNITVLDRVLESNIVLLPLVSRGTNTGSENEKISVRNFYESTKLLGAYLFQLAK